MISFSYVTIILTVVAVYVFFIRPFATALQQVSSDSELSTHLKTIAEFRQFDERSYDKATSHLKLFMMGYSDSFSHDIRSQLERCKRQKNRTMKYLLRIPFRVHNDANLTERLENAISSIETILENYLVEAHDRRGEYHF